VSGGHSHLMLIKNIATDVTELGGTLDDAAGEAFDKVGRLLGLPYPGGPHIDRLAREGNPNAIRFPRALRSGKNQEKHPYDYSFSGLKTAVARHIEGLNARGEELPKADIAAGFTEAVVGALVEKAVTACQAHDCDTLVIGGGFSANSRLRELAATEAEKYGLTVRIPPIRYCTDNGAMIAALGWHMVANGVAPSPLDISVDTGLPRETTILR
ncbi:MAG: tRNA (adenosine(37)-N6)-threonylcarbamoyltransferase complex transferase subunit TsaD, partial [Arcanobacterium sp.]|nr:tRNA (adenosine(37)-N6)-threonylcarbamoyltransferase complex transferase subunit TsaD [Arcanobacterium sp.]